MAMFANALAAALTALVLGSAAGAAQPGADPLIREGATEKISEHVFVIPDFSTPLTPNVGIIVGARATLVIDTGLGDRNGQAILREVAKVSSNRELYLVTTHVHPEHDLGAHAFKGYRLIRSRDQQRDIAAQGLRLAETFARRSPPTAELLAGATYREADIVFESEHRLDLGGVSVRILAMGPNHTLGDTAVFVEPDGVLFSGDVVMPGQPSFATAEASLPRWRASLDRLAALSPVRLVPSHGAMGGPELIEAYRDYFLTIERRVAALKAEGRTQQEATAQITAEMASRWPDAGRLGGAIRNGWGG